MTFVERINNIPERSVICPMAHHFSQWSQKLYLSLSDSDFPGGSDGKASAYNAGDPGSIPGLGGSLEKEMATPPQYSCLDNPTDGGAW